MSNTHTMTLTHTEYELVRVALAMSYLFYTDRTLLEFALQGSRMERAIMLVSISDLERRHFPEVKP